MSQIIGKRAKNEMQQCDNPQCFRKQKLLILSLKLQNKNCVHGLVKLEKNFMRHIDMY